MSAKTMKITALASWYGSNRMLAQKVGELLRGLEWVGIPFAGGMCEIAHLKARTILASDLHRHVIHLAMTVKNERTKDELVAALRAPDVMLHPDVLRTAQYRCETLWESGSLPDEPIIEWARDYFIAVWMARNGTAGSDGEFRAGPSIRWNATGGDSAARFNNAVDSLDAWCREFKRCTFVCLDVFPFLENVKDQKGHGLYLDAPWPTDGEKYRHKFGESHQRRLAGRVSEFKDCRVVIRFGDHPLIRELYPEPLWTWHGQTGRTAANKPKAEVLIVNDRAAGESFT